MEKRLGFLKEKLKRSWFLKNCHLLINRINDNNNNNNNFLENDIVHRSCIDNTMTIQYYVGLPFFKKFDGVI